jgi:hypothetical protein
MSKHAELLCLIVGWLFMVMGALSEVMWVTEASFAMIAVAGAMRLAKVVFARNQYWALCNIVAGAGMVSYLGGAFVTLIQYTPSSYQFQALVGEEFTQRSATAVIYLSLFYIALVGLARFENRFWQDALKRIDVTGEWLSDSVTRHFLTVVLIVLPIAQIALLASGRVVSGAVTVLGTYKVDPVAVLTGDLTEPVLAIAAWIVGTRQKRSPVLLTLALLCLAGDILWFGAVGRRVILYGTITFAVFYLWARGQSRLRHPILIGVPAVGILSFVWRVFVAMRYSSYNWAGSENLVTFADLVKDGISLVLNQSDLIAALESENYGSRFFVLGHLCTVMSRLTLQDAQYGLFIFISFFLAVPNIILPVKSEILEINEWGSDGKMIVNKAIGLTMDDVPWTPFVAGFSDFMWAGAIIYPLLICAIGWGFSRIIRSLRFPVLAVGSFGICLIRFLSTETTLSALLLAGRTLVIIWLLQWVMNYFTGRSKTGHLTAAEG